MQKITINLPAALLHYDNVLCRYRFPLLPDIDGFLKNKEELVHRITPYMQYRVENLYGNFLSPCTSIPPEILFTSFPNLNFTTRSFVCHFPISIKQKITTPIKLDAFCTPIENGGTFVWIPIQNIFYTVPEDNPSDIQLAAGMSRMIQCLKLEEDLDFVLRCTQVLKVEYLPLKLELSIPTSYHIAKLLYENQDKEETINPKTLGFRPFQPDEKEMIFGLEKEVEFMSRSFRQKIPVSILLVGPSGCGKTTLWHKFAKSITRNNLNWALWEIDTVLLGARSQNDIYGPHDKVTLMVKYCAIKKAILYMGNLWEIAQTGMNAYSNHSLVDTLLDPISQGTLPVVMECSLEQYSILEREHPHFLTPFLRIDLPILEPNQVQETLRYVFIKQEKKDIKQEKKDIPDRSLALEEKDTTTNLKGRENGPITEEALIKTESLFCRFPPRTVSPGAQLTFLHKIISRQENKEDQPITDRDVSLFFAEQTGLPTFMLDDDVLLDREETHRFFADRVIGQDGTSSTNGSTTKNDLNAVPVIVDLIMTIKSQMTRRSGPIATLLFIGPTGVGKTEMAKTIAEFLYSNPNRMIRIDMSEYAEYGSADRLINGNENGEGILTSQVREQPFSVILLDEFEKAHPSIFDFLLQIFGEGRLTDRKGRLADFRNCVIILTSNLGVENFGRLETGFKASEMTEVSTIRYFTDEVKRLVRPELLNRIDRIVPFHPLSKETLRSILNREIKLLNRRQGISARSLVLSIDPEVGDELVLLGYDQKYGARPLKRTIERQILLPLADALTNVPLKTPVKALFNMVQGKIKLKIILSTPENENVGIQNMNISENINDRMNMSMDNELQKKVRFDFSKLRYDLQRLMALTEYDNYNRDLCCFDYNQKKEQRKQEVLTKHNRRNIINSNDLNVMHYEKIRSLISKTNNLYENIIDKEVAVYSDNISLDVIQTEIDAYRSEMDNLLKEYFIKKNLRLQLPVYFWLVSCSQSFLTYCLQLFHLTAQKYGTTVKSWRTRYFPNGKPLQDIPENNEINDFLDYMFCPDTLVPINFLLYNHNSPHLAVINSIPILQNILKTKHFPNINEGHYIGMRPVKVSPDGYLNNDYSDPLGMFHAAVMEVKDPFTAIVFNEYCGEFRAVNKNQKKETPLRMSVTCNSERIPLISFIDMFNKNHNITKNFSFKKNDNEFVFLCDDKNYNLESEALRVLRQTIFASIDD